MDMTNSEVSELLVRLDERTKQTAEQVDAICHVLEGNGRPGLVEIAARVDERIEVLEKHVAANRMTLPIVAGLCLTIGLAVIGWLVAA